MGPSISIFMVGFFQACLLALRLLTCCCLHEIHSITVVLTAAYVDMYLQYCPFLIPENDVAAETTPETIPQCTKSANE